MKALSGFSAFTKVAGSMLGFLLLFLLGASFQSAPPSDGLIEKGFTLDNFAKETIELTIEQPGSIEATAEWSPEKAELALILFGPGQMNYYRRSDGKSPLELSFTVTEQDTAEGSSWRLKLVNQSGETVEGKLRVSYPAVEEAGEVLQ
ncbi:MAG: hypothetical protein KDD01_03205 [Phaeodactylibacter sp.]|nr:hypothetical protein [Phaeodactylibacter sp.]